MITENVTLPREKQSNPGARESTTRKREKPQEVPPYRLDVDGLRAVAISLVTLFHAGVPWCPGGFVGVDVFFVISGFLITGILLRDMRARKFSFVEFYVRRTKRILPALIAVMTLVYVAGFALLGPSEFKDLAGSVSTAALSASNIFFWKQTDYFADASDMKPLLMTWSLGVEEQFYLVWPLALFLFFRSRVPLSIPVAFLGLTSFGLASWGVQQGRLGAFYLLPGRAWEFLVGTLIALQYSTQASPLGGFIKGLRNLASACGLALILGSSILFDRTTLFPGINALVPCVGTALLLWSGPESLVNRSFLSLRPVVLVGLISYSLYLWHWPLLAFTRIQHHGDLPLSAALVAVLLAVLLAYFSWRYVEQPLRHRIPQSRVVELFNYAAVMLVLAIAGGVTWHASGFPGRVPLHIARADAARQGPRHPNSPIRNSYTSPIVRSSCPSELDCSGSKVLLWGDSHAGSVTPLVQQWARTRGSQIRILRRNACPPLRGARILNRGVEDRDCNLFNERAFEEVTRDPRLSTIVLAARWAYYTENGWKHDTMFLTDTKSTALTRNNSRRVFVDKLREESAAILSSGRELVIIGPIPEIGIHVPNCFVRRAMPLGLWRSCSARTAEVAARTHFAIETIEALARELSLRRFYPTSVLCSGEECITSLNDDLLYIDDNHLTVRGSLLLLEPMIQSVRPSTFDPSVSNAR